MASFVLYERVSADPDSGGKWHHRTFRKLEKAIVALGLTANVAYIVVDGVQRYRNRPGRGTVRKATSVWELAGTSGTASSAQPNARQGAAS